jgi:large subunit ribosomal protein L24
MSTKMRVKKGDLVQVLSGKDRGKQGRVLEARPGERRVIVENLNMIKRHTKPRPIREASRMGGAQIIPGGVIEKAAPIPVANVMVVCPTCKRATRVGIHERELKSGEVVRVRVCKRADCLQEIDQV